MLCDVLNKYHRKTAVWVFTFHLARHSRKSCWALAGEGKTNSKPYTHQFFANTRCHQEDYPRTVDDIDGMRERERERERESQRNLCSWQVLILTNRACLRKEARMFKKIVSYLLLVYLLLNKNPI